LAITTKPPGLKGIRISSAEEQKYRRLKKYWLDFRKYLSPFCLNGIKI
jgi:hypothetical protein